MKVVTFFMSRTVYCLLFFCFLCFAFIFLSLLIFVLILWFLFLSLSFFPYHHPSKHTLVCPSVKHHFFLLFQSLRTFFFITAIFHQHVTWAAIYQALFFFHFSFII